MKKLILTLVGAIALLTSSCQTIKSWRDEAALKAGYVIKDKYEGLIEQSKKEYAQKLLEKDAQIEKDKEAFKAGLLNEMQFASDKLYGADFDFQLILTPDRNHIIMDNHINEARAVMPPPSIKGMAEENKRVKIELNEALTSLADLQKTHETEVTKAKGLQAQVEKAASDLEQDKKDKQKIKDDAETVQDALQDKLNKTNDTIEAQQQQNIENEKNIKAMKEKLALYIGVFGLGCLAGAVFSPVFKIQLGILAAIASLMAVGIFYITGTVLLCIGIVLVALVIGWAVLEHNKESKTSMAVYQGLQDLKNKNKAVWDETVGPTLKEWQTKYVTKDGKITEVPDPSIENQIDKKLASVGDK